MLQKDELCGGEKGCEDAWDVACVGCGEVWKPEDIDAPGDCRACGSPEYQRLRCEACPLTRLDEALESEAGVLLTRTSDLEFALDKHFHMTLDDLSCIEFKALRVMNSVREDFQREHKDGE